MAQAVLPFLMFDGVAEEAIRFYTSLFRNSEIKRIERYGAGEPGREGSVKRADFTLSGREWICIDSPTKHGFTFTPSISLFVECENESELENAFNQLSAGGEGQRSWSSSYNQFNIYVLPKVPFGISKWF